MKNSTLHVFRQIESPRAELAGTNLPAANQLPVVHFLPAVHLPLGSRAAGVLWNAAVFSAAAFSAAVLLGATVLNQPAFAATHSPSPAFALTSSVSQPANQKQPDQVFVREESGALRPVSGVLTENNLNGVAIGSERFDADRIAHISFGSVPPSFREAKNYFERKAFAEAAAKYRLAAGESDRNVVQAAARLRAAQALLYVGSVDSSAFADADREATRFLEDFPKNREVPLGRYIQATARFLSGDAAAAGALFQAVYDEVANSVPSEGYDIALGYKSGLRGASAYLEAGMTQEAREIFQRMTSALPALIAGMTEEDRSYGDMLAIQASARLGEGYALLAGGNSSRAVDFFREQLDGATRASDESSRLSTAALTFGARLGLGLSLAKEGQYRPAQMELAIVSSLDHTDRDRVARALLGLAECALNLPDSDSRSQARAWVETVLNQYADTLWVQRAHALLGTL